MSDADLIPDSGPRKRQPISKTRRFEIFKRDGFACQYCGATPPDAVLEVEHIVAIANGGSNDDHNLTTACLPCNRGKGVRPLDVAPQGLADRAADVLECEAQMRGYVAVMEAQRERVEADVWRVVRRLYGQDCDSISHDRFRSIKVFLGRMNVLDAEEAVDITLAKRWWSKTREWKYFCAVCWNMIRAAENG